MERDRQAAMDKARARRQRRGKATATKGRRRKNANGSGASDSLTEKVMDAAQAALDKLGNIATATTQKVKAVIS